MIIILYDDLHGKETPSLSLAKKNVEGIREQNVEEKVCRLKREMTGSW
jgi:hypothetical protein